MGLAKQKIDRKQLAWSKLVELVLLAIILVSPWLKGLFFPAQMLPVLIIIGLIFVIYLWTQCIGEFTYLDLGVLLLGLFYTISLVHPIIYQDAISGWLAVCSYIMVFFIAARSGKSDQFIKRLALTVYLSGLGLAVIGLGAALGWVPFPGAFADDYIRSALQYHNATAIYLAVSCLLGLGLAVTAYNRWQIALYLVGTLIMGVTILGTLSRASWVLALVFLAIYVVILPAGKRVQTVKLAGTFLLTVLLTGRVVQNAYLAQDSWLAFLVLLAGCLVFSVLGLIIMGTFDNAKSKAVSKKTKGEKQDLNQVYPNQTRAILLASMGLLLLIYLTGIVKYPPTSPLHYLFPDRVIARADQTFTDDTSKNERLVSYQDAIKIIKDYPLTGTGGGGWAALYHSYANNLYWVNELHNYYLKVAVETGIPGLLIVAAIGIMFLYLLVSNFKKISVGEDGALMFASSLAVIMLAAHAAMDFDLSIPAIAITFFALMGAIRGTLSPNPVKRERKGQTPVAHFWMRGAGLIVALVVMVVAGGMFAGRLWSDKGAEALAKKQLPTAESFYQQAVKVDPFNGEHKANLARIAALQAVDQHDQTSYGEALQYAERTIELGANKPELLGNLYVTYGLLGRQDLQIAAATQAIKVNPFAPEPYRLLASTVMNATWKFLDAGQFALAKPYLAELIRVRGNLTPNLNNKLPDLDLAAGQAALLIGDTAKAQMYLQPLIYYRGQTGKQAQNWLGAAEEMDRFDKNRSMPDETEYLNQLQQILILQMKKSGM